MAFETTDSAASHYSAASYVVVGEAGFSFNLVTEAWVRRAARRLLGGFDFGWLRRWAAVWSQAVRIRAGPVVKWVAGARRARDRFGRRARRCFGPEISGWCWICNFGEEPFFVVAIVFLSQGSLF